MSDHKVLTVEGPKEWTGTYGVSYDWRLALEGPDGMPLPHPAILTTKKPDNGPTAGQTLNLEVGPHPRLENTLKAKRVQEQFNNGSNTGGGGRRSDPNERASIEAQVAMKCAVEYAGHMASAGRLPENFNAGAVADVAGVFFNAIHGAAANA
jgi:hypothetical protein